MGIGSEGFVLNPVQNVQDGSAQVVPILGRSAEMLQSPIHGDMFNVALRGKAFRFAVSAVTVPVVASGLVSVFSLFNPPNSNTIAELIDVTIDQVLATTVVDTFGWYASFGSVAAAATFTTKGVALTNYFSARFGDTPGGAVIPYSAATHSGTPVLQDTIGSHGATSNNIGIRKQYRGNALILPGTLISLAASTAASTASGLALSCTWAEWPFTQ